MAAAEAAQGTARVDDFSCGICYELCVEPVVGNCGHDFCRHCLTRWTTQQRRAAARMVTCPVCRGVFASTAVQDLNVCIRLRDTIQLLFPEQLESRKAEVQQEAAEVAAAAAAVDAAGAGRSTVHDPLEGGLLGRLRPLGANAASPLLTLDSLVTVTQSLLGVLGGQLSHRAAAAQIAGIPGFTQAAAGVAAASPPAAPAFPGFPSPPAPALPLSPSAGQQTGLTTRMPAAAAPAAAATPVGQAFGTSGAASSSGLGGAAISSPPSVLPRVQIWSADGQVIEAVQHQTWVQQLNAAQQGALDAANRLRQVEANRLRQRASQQQEVQQLYQVQQVHDAQQSTLEQDLVFRRSGGVSPSQASLAAAGSSITWGAQLNTTGMLPGTVPSPFAAVGPHASRVQTAGVAFPAAAPQQQLPVLPAQPVFTMGWGAAAPQQHVSVLPAQPVFTMGWYNPRPRATPASRRERRRRTNLRFQRPGRRQHPR